MHVSGLALGLGAAALLAAPAQAKAQYALSTTYDATNFFSSFDFFTEKDPTHGFVEYVDRTTAHQQGLIGYGHASNGSTNGSINGTHSSIKDTHSSFNGTHSSFNGTHSSFNGTHGSTNGTHGGTNGTNGTRGSVILGVDHKTHNPPNGRRSVRVTSHKSFTRGLFVADIAHMPGNACGVWPAFWMFGPNWPSSGEIDIIEGVNSQPTGAVTLHTGPGCSVANTGAHASTVLKSADVHNYGDGFNDVGGGVYATEWTSDHIAVWFFRRAAIPRDVAAGRPDPASWGPPAARFLGGQGCDIDAHFADNQLVFDTTFCGDWAGNPSVWAADATCSAKAATCDDYVANNPADFRDAFWEINSIKVYQQQQQQQPPAGKQGKVARVARKPWRA